MSTKGDVNRPSELLSDNENGAVFDVIGRRCTVRFFNFLPLPHHVTPHFPKIDWYFLPKKDKKYLVRGWE